MKIDSLKRNQFSIIYLSKQYDSVKPKVVNNFKMKPLIQKILIDLNRIKINIAFYFMQAITFLYLYLPNIFNNILTFKIKYIQPPILSSKNIFVYNKTTKNNSVEIS